MKANADSDADPYHSSMKRKPNRIRQDMASPGAGSEAVSFFAA